MTVLFLDLSGKSPRYLLLDGERPVAYGTTPEPAASPDDLHRLLTAIASDTGQRIHRAHLVVPDREVTSGTYTLQEMPLDDAAKIIARRIGATGGEMEPLLLTLMNTLNRQQTFLTEQFSRQNLASYNDSFAAARIRLKTVTTPLQGLLAAVAPFRAEMLQPHALFSIDGGFVTALFLSATEIHHYVRLPLPTPEAETDGAERSERALRRKLFDILNLLHGVYSQFMLDNPHFHMGKAWLCGAEAGIDGLTVSLADAMDIEVDLLQPPSGIAADDQAFAILAGLAATCDDPKHGNFFADPPVRTLFLRSRGIRLVAAVLLAVAIAGLVIITEGRVVRLNRELAEVGRSAADLKASAPEAESLARQLEAIRETAEHRVPFYEILKTLAEKLPDQVQLDSLRYRMGTGGDILELVLVTDVLPEGDQSPVLSAVTGMLDASPSLAQYADPAIAIIRDEDRRLTQLTIACTIAPARGGRP